MPVIHSTDASVHELHGTKFSSYVRPQTGSTELCGWRIEIPGHSQGVPHRVSREEVIYILEGTISVTLDDTGHEAGPGDVVVIPAGSMLRVDNPASEPVTAWVTTSVGFVGIMADGSVLNPPWTL